MMIRLFVPGVLNHHMAEEVLTHRQLGTSLDGGRPIHSA